MDLSISSQRKCYPKPPRNHIGYNAKFKKTLLLSGDSAVAKRIREDRKIHCPPSQQNLVDLSKSKTNYGADQEAENEDLIYLNDLPPEQEASGKSTANCNGCAWTPVKVERAKELFELYETNSKSLTFEAIAEELDLTKEELADGWLDYQKDRSMKGIKRIMDLEHKLYNSKNSYLRAKLVDILQKNPFLSLTQMKLILLNQLKGELKKGQRFDLSEKKLAWLLKSAGYTCRKYASIGASNEQPVEVNEEKKIFQFCRFVRSLRPTKIPMFFYHETEISRSLQQKQKWVQHTDSQFPQFRSELVFHLRCLLSPEGVGVWMVTQKLFQRSHFEELIHKMKQKGSQIDPIKRKYLILDKRVISNKEQFCEVVQQYSYDILCQPFGSQKLNPIEKWFKVLRTELERPRGHTSQTKRQNIECLLQRYNQKSFERYVTQFYQQVISSGRNSG